MIESAKVARIVSDSKKYGVSVKDFSIDFSRVADRRDAVVEQTRNFVTELLNQNNVDIYQGEGKVLSSNKVMVNGGKLNEDGKTMHYDGQKIEVDTENIIIATGS